jgi:cytochrome c oxidase subunit II
MSRRLHKYARLLPLPLLVVLTGCIYNRQSVTEPAGPESGRIGILWWSFFWLLGGIFIIVMIVTMLTLARRRPGVEQASIEQNHKALESTEHLLRTLVGASTVTTIVILFALIFASVRTGKANLELAYKKNPLTIQVTGTQWWWQIQYVSDDPTQNLVTANEMHIPVGRPFTFWACRTM